VSTAQKPGRFITFEGGEGAGKSTQIERLNRRLRASGIDTVITREPGGSPKAERIREVLLAGRAKPLGPFAEAVLFAAARADHLEKTIRPALARGAFVLCDRFSDSTRAYQGALGKVEEGLLAGLERIVVGGTRPDLTLVLDVPAQIGLARAGTRRKRSRADRFEAEGAPFHEALREAFRSIVLAEPERCVLIDAVPGPDEVERAIWEVVRRRLLERSAAATGELSHAAG
jgi:dTMP kinase